MKASDGLDTRWITDLIKNIFKKGSIPYYLREYPDVCVQGRK